MRQLTIGACLLAAAAYAAPTIPTSSVQFFEANAADAVHVSYTLVGEPAVVTLSFEADGAKVDETRYLGLSGDVNRLVQPGARHIMLTGYTPFWQNSSTVKATLRAWCTNSPPDYMVVHLTNTPVTVNYYANTNAIPGGIQDRYHKSFGLTLRKIPAAGRVWSMGKPLFSRALSTYHAAARHDVKLTEDYYIGVYEFTFGNRHGLAPADYNKTSDWMNGDLDRLGVADNTEYPFLQMSYTSIRGRSGYGEYVAGWPANGHDISNITPSSGFNPCLISRVRTLTGLMLDLPTEAQWEFACQGDGTIPFYNGYPDNSRPYLHYKGDTGIPYHESIDDYGWHILNSTNANSQTCAPHPVGQKLPNGYGLYDMLGNAIEWSLDYHAAFDTSVNPAIDPEGASVEQATKETSGQERPYRVLKGGGYSTRPDYLNCFMRWGWCCDYTDFTGNASKQSDTDYCYRSAEGFRLVCPAIAIK